MGFRFKRAVPVGYDRQGLIFFVSRAYRELPLTAQNKILRLCTEAGGEHYQALFEFVTTDRGAMAVCMKHHLSESTLERVVRRYYVLFAQEFT